MIPRIRLFVTLSAAAAVFAGAYALLFSAREPLRLETLFGDPALLDGCEISFSLADSLLEQRYTLRGGTITQKNCFGEDTREWPLQTLTEQAFDAQGSPTGEYLYQQFESDGCDYLLRPQARPDKSGTLLPPGVERMLLYSDDRSRAVPLILLESDAILERFWCCENALYCAVRHGSQTELRQYTLDGEPTAVYPLGEPKAGLLATAYPTTAAVSWRGSSFSSDGSGTLHISSDYPPEPDGTQLFPLGGRLLAIGAWVEPEASGIDLYVLEPKKLLYHGRIATTIWQDYRGSGYYYGESPHTGRPEPDAPLRYFTAVTLSDTAQTLEDEP